MKKLVISIFILLTVIEAICQTNPNTYQPYSYTKIEPLVKKIDGEKIKMVMANYQHNEVKVITRKKSISLTKREAANLGIIPPLPEIKPFKIYTPLYRNVINIIEIENFEAKKEKIVSNEARVYTYIDTEIRAEIYIPDSVTFYKINLQNSDTIGVCKKETLKLVGEESIIPQVTYGDIFGKMVTPELLKQQKEIKLPAGFELVTATAYFAGPGYMNILVGSINKKDLSPLRKLLDSCRDESVISFDNVILKTPGGKLMRVRGRSIKVGIICEPFNTKIPKIQFGFITQPRANHLDFITQKKIYVPDGFEFVSAVIHFAGAGYEQPSSLDLKTSDITILKHYLRDCRPGTIVQIDTIKLRDNNGNIVNAEDFVCALF